MEQVLLTQGTQIDRVAGGDAISSGLRARGGWTRLLGRVVVVPGVLGLLLGAVAAIADGAAGSVGIALSLPGLWIAAAVAVTTVAGRSAANETPRAGGSAVAMALFLAAGVVAYYAGKDALTNSVPGPLAAFWLLLAMVVGLVGGAATAWIGARTWGPAVLVASVGGWLVAETITVPAAPWGEAALAIVVGAIVAAWARPARPSAWIAGGATGAAGAVLVLGVLPGVLSQLL